ncbi:MAG: hypothetical protein ABI612_26685, partial [Betaproteobacteria bacterium]
AALRGPVESIVAFGDVSIFVYGKTALSLCDPRPGVRSLERTLRECGSDTAALACGALPCSALCIDANGITQSNSAALSCFGIRRT